MKIAIFETEHFEGAFPVIKLFDKPGNRITIITSEETHKRFTDLFFNDANRYDWAILTTGVKFRFFYSLYKNLKKQKPDLLYINTISNNHILYALVLSLLSAKRVVLTVHDINCLFESKFKWNFRQAIIYWGKRWLVKQVNEFNVVSDTMTAYLQTKTKQNKTHNIPGAVFEHKQSPQKIEGSIRLVVPGSLDKRRRDYQQIFDLASLADKEKLRLQIILLGGYFDDDGKAITIRVNSTEYDFVEISCYETNVVDQDEFDRQMDAAHFVFIPSVIHTKICGDIPEIYGITKSSGNIFDVIKHAKPFIVPAGLTVSLQLQTSCFKYSGITDIADFLESVVDSREDYALWQQNALTNSLNYTIEKVRERNITLFE
ncbi:MAG TPA: glycosyltransferase [Chitinophagaceae bacterium]